MRTAELRCVEVKNGSEVQQDGFLLFNNMKVPDFAERSDGDQDKCGRDCLGNCSCLAYGYDPYIGCMYWSRDLIDLQKFPSGGVDLFIRVPAELGVCLLLSFIFRIILWFHVLPSSSRVYRARKYENRKILIYSLLKFKDVSICVIFSVSYF